MIPEKETITVEFKSDRGKLNDSILVDAVVAFANTEGGRIFLGVEDDGTVTGLHREHMDPYGQEAMIINKTVPGVAVHSEMTEEQGKKIMIITVPKKNAIIASSDGKVLKRRLKQDGTPENVPMYPFEMQTRLSDLNMLDFSSQILPDTTIEDLDPLERQRLRNIIRLRKGEGILLELSDEELDKALHFVRELNGKLYVTVAGLLMIGKAERLQQIIPTAKSSFQVLEGTSVRINEDYSLPLLATFERFEEMFKPWNSEQEMEYGLIRIPIPSFSQIAFREALVNAFCHRNYTVLGRVRVQIDDEGLTISSPGGFIDGVTLDNLLTVEPHGRNPLLADIFKRIGLAEKTGRGIDRIYEGSISFGRPFPDYSGTTSSNVVLFIERVAADIPFMKMVYDEEESAGKSLSFIELMVLSVLRSDHRCSIDELVSFTKYAREKVKRATENLVECGLVEPAGSGRHRDYILSSKVYKVFDMNDAYNRQIGLTKENMTNSILKLFSEGKRLSKSEVAAASGLSLSSCYRILSDLVAKGVLRFEGKGRGTRYCLSEEAYDTDEE